MSSGNYESAYTWNEVTTDKWKIIAVQVMPSDPAEGCYWAHHIPNGQEEVHNQRERKQIVTALKRLEDNRLVLLAQRVSKTRHEGERIQALPGKASWL